MAASPHYRSRFGDTTLTKVFVGGLAWETPNEELRHYFEQFGDILEAVVITDKNTGRSKGYGFVTFRDPESARSACVDPNPVIDGRRANCNIASLGRPRPSPPRVVGLFYYLHRGHLKWGRTQVGNPYASPPYSRMPAQMMAPPPPPAIYPPYGYVTYTADYGYQQALYNPQLEQQYYHQLYGPHSSSSNVVGPPYQYQPQVRYAVPAFPRPSFSSGPQAVHRMQGPDLPYAQYPMMPPGEASLGPTSSQPYTFQLQPPPPTRQQPHIGIAESQTSHQLSSTGTNTESSDA